MRNWVTLLMTLLVGATSYSNASTGQFDFEAGYRNDRITWEHRFPSYGDDAVGSKQKFKDLDIFQIGVNGRTTLGCNLYLRGSAYLGWILDGDFKQDRELYLGSYYNSGDVELSGDKVVIDDQYVYGASAAIGYPFYFCDCTMKVAPVIGYAADIQNIHLDGGHFADCYGNGGCCTQKFNNTWYGPFVGLDLMYNPYCECWSLWGELEYHWGDFKGRRGHYDESDYTDHGNRHSSDVNAWVLNFGGDYQICNDWTVGLSFKFQDWHAKKHSRYHGGDSSSGYYSSDSDSGNSGDRIRNKASWNSYAINVTAGYQF